MGALIALVAGLAVPGPAGAQVPAAGWRQLPTTSDFDAAVVVSGAVLYSFAVNQSGQLVLHEFDEGDVGDDMRNLGGTLISSPAAITHPADGNRVYVFAQGLDDALWYQVVDSETSSGWQSLGGRIQGTPALAMGAGDGILNVFARGADNALWYRSIAGPGPGFTEWRSLGGNLLTDPTTTSRDLQLPAVVGVGVDNALWTGQLRDDGFWIGWTPLGGLTDSSPWMTANDTGAYAFVRGLDRALWVNHLNDDSQWSGWRSIGGVFDSAPGAFAGPDGIIALGVGQDGAGWYASVTPTTATGWTSVGGNLVISIRGAQHETGGYIYSNGVDGMLYVQRL